jgi:general secretion pathway protein F
LQFLLYFVFPKFEAVMYDMGIPLHWALAWMGWIGNLMGKYAYVFPLVLLVLLGLWLSSRRALSLQGRRPAGVLRYFPWMGRLMAGFQAASFADLLALLLENGVPYPEALRLAGDASGDPSLAASGGEVAAAIERGEPPATVLQHRSSLPPLLRWVVATGPWQGDLVSALRQMGRRYRADARFQADKIRVLMPTFLLLVIGLTSTALYAAAVFGPLTTLWTSLAQPMN